eukprot:scaffold2423_cov113-Isochrysis_galbana.AAC.4
MRPRGDRTPSPPAASRARVAPCLLGRQLCRRGQQRQVRICVQSRERVGPTRQRAKEPLLVKGPGEPERLVGHRRIRRGPRGCSHPHKRLANAAKLDLQRRLPPALAQRGTEPRHSPRKVQRQPLADRQGLHLAGCPTRRASRSSTGAAVNTENVLVGIEQPRQQLVECVPRRPYLREAAPLERVQHRGGPRGHKARPQRRLTPSNLGHEQPDAPRQRLVAGGREGERGRREVVPDEVAAERARRRGGVGPAHMRRRLPPAVWLPRRVEACRRVEGPQQPVRLERQEESHVERLGLVVGRARREPDCGEGQRRQRRHRREGGAADAATASAPLGPTALHRLAHISAPTPNPLKHSGRNRLSHPATRLPIGHVPSLLS